MGFSGGRWMFGLDGTEVFYQSWWFCDSMTFHLKTVRSMAALKLWCSSSKKAVLLHHVTSHYVRSTSSRCSLPHSRLQVKYFFNADLQYLCPCIWKATHKSMVCNKAFDPELREACDYLRQQTKRGEFAASSCFARLGRVAGAAVVPRGGFSWIMREHHSFACIQYIRWFNVLLAFIIHNNSLLINHF